MSGEPTDEQLLVARANEGDPHAFEAMYRGHKDWVVALAYRFTGSREDALDVLQETFAWFFDRFPGFELTSSLRSFLYPVVKHRSISLIRKRKKVVDLAAMREGGLEESAALSWTPEPPGEFARMIGGLSDGHREVVRMRFALGLRLEEIAAALGLPLGTVKSRLHNALKSLRTEQEREDSDPP